MRRGTTMLLAAALAVWPAANGMADDQPRKGPTVFDITAYGAKGDGVEDCTAAIQAAIDRAAEKGGQVHVPPGKFLVSGSIKVKPGVAVVGSATAPLYIKPLIGSVILATGGREKEDGPALFELGDSSSVQGITIYYPEQKPTDIRPYAWTFHLQGGDNTVENVTLINSYNAIRVGPEPNVRHRIRSVYGCALRRGILVDNCTDIGRVENVQFHCHWWSAPEVGGAWDPVFEYMWRNLEAFVFGRTDWEFITNNFVFPTNIGYRFIQTPNGAANGHLVGNGSDASQVAVQVDAIQPMGLLITNGQFVSFNGPNPRGLVVSETCTGQVRLVNCNYWGSFKTIAELKGRSFVGFSDCYFSAWDHKGEGLPAIEALSGRVQVQGCSFVGGLGVRVGAKVRHAIITGNNGTNGVRIQDESGRAIIRDNEPHPSPLPASESYTLEIGGIEDHDYLTGKWNGPEHAANGPDGARSFRWTTGESGVRLPLVPGKDYQVTVWVTVTRPDASSSVGIAGGENVKLDKAGTHVVRLALSREQSVKQPEAELVFRVKAWVPREVGFGTDDRVLGVQVYRVAVAPKS